MKKATYIEAIQITINDFEIALRAIPWWNFRESSKLITLIGRYEDILAMEKLRSI